MRPPPLEGHAIDDVAEHLARVAAVVANAKLAPPDPAPAGWEPNREEHHEHDRRP